MAGFGSMSVCILAVFFVAGVSATEFRVGGKSGWSVPSGSGTESFNQWAERLRFHVGDTLLFKYTAKQDSVLVVTAQAFQTCNTTAPVAVYDDGNTVFKFPKSGPFYFISGAEGHCDKGQKVVVVVMAQGGGRRGGDALPPAGAPAFASSPSAGNAGDESPAMSPFGSPAVAPASGATASVVSVASSVVVCVAVVAAFLV